MKKRVITIIKKYRYTSILLGLFLIICGVHYPLLSLGFFSDDYHMLKIVSETTQSLAQLFTTNLIETNVGHSYGPIFKLLFIAEYNVFGLEPLGYHIISLVLHVACTFGVYLFVHRLFKTYSLSLAAAGIFSVLPVHVEALAWVGVQPHLIAACGYIYCLYSYLVYKETGKHRYFIVSLVLFTFALFAKDIAITGVIAILCTEWYVWATTPIAQPSYIWRQVWKTTIRAFPYVCITLLYLLLRSHATGSASASYTGALQLNIQNMVHMGIQMITAMWFPGARVAFGRMMYEHILLITLISGTMLSYALYWGRKQKAWTLCVFLYLISLVPYTFLSFNQINEEGNRYVYLSSLFGIIVWIYVLQRVIKKIVGAYHYAWYAGIIVCICALSFYSTIHRFTAWQLADNMVKQIVKTPLQVSTEEMYVFLGLPDNIDGAQVFRNGIVEAFLLEQTLPIDQAERIPIYTQFSTKHVTQNLTVEVSTSTNNIKITSSISAKGFTGFGAFVSSQGTFSLSNWDPWGSVGDTIEILPQQSMTLMVYSHGQLVPHRVE